MNSTAGFPEGDATRAGAGQSLPMSWRRRIRLGIMRHLLRRRYRVELDQPGRIQELTQGPVLVLPNHPAYIDPPLVLASIPWKISLRPLVYTDTFRHPMLHRLVTGLDALEVPELRRDSRTAARQMVALLRSVKQGLQNGESFLVYPSGRLQRDGKEKIGAARSAFELIKAAPPETKIVLLRSRGLWGSRFSCANTGRVPDLGRTMLRSLVAVIANFWWWMPKRRVIFSHGVVSCESLQGLSREELNRWLESWYDSDGGEALTQVSSHFATDLLGRPKATPKRRTPGIVRGWRARAALQANRIRQAARRRRKRKLVRDDSFSRDRGD